MKIITFETIDEKYTEGFDVCYIHSGCSDKADVAILDINTIFDYEEKKLSVCKEDFTSIAIIDDPSDYDAFKNFGITAWIQRDNLESLPELLTQIKQKMSL